MKEAAAKIRFHYLYNDFSFTGRTRIKTFLLQQLKKEGKKVEAINYIFCDDTYLYQMNTQYLDHDTLTDIITFELSPMGQPLLSDIYISIERVKENAKTYHTSFRDELLRVIFHGALHLAGYKDKKEAEAEQMRVKENEYLEKFKVSRDTVSS